MMLPSSIDHRRTLLLLCLACALMACGGLSVVGGPPVDGGDVSDLGGRDVTDVGSNLDAPDSGSRCVVAADTCPASQHCDPTTLVCVDGCRADDGCRAGFGDGGLGDGGADGGAAAAGVCDPVAHRCVQCRVDDHCPGGMLCVGQVCATGCSASRSCPGGGTCCAGACVDTNTNFAACGACGTVCATPNGSPVCASGQCAVASCTAPFVDCNGIAADGCEVDTSSNDSNCGRCGRACAASRGTSACRAGACAVTACDPGFANCDGDPANGCEVDTNTSAANCNGCGMVCTFPNAAPTCVGGTCTPGACNAGFGDCDNMRPNGCETPTTTTTNCGSCGRACTFANAAASCASPDCVLGACDIGFRNCDSDATNGCEVDVRSSATNCGACGQVCSSGLCTASACDRGGDGADGVASFLVTATLTPAATAMQAEVAAGATVLPVLSVTGFTVGSEVLVIDMQGTDAGHYEYGRVSALSTTVGAVSLTLAMGVTAAFRGTTGRVQVVRVFHYTALTVGAGATLRAPAWDGTTGGVLPIRVSGIATITGDLVANGAGFRGGAGDLGLSACGAGRQGESQLGAGVLLTTANGGGGGGGKGSALSSSFASCCVIDPVNHLPNGGGGASYGAAGTAGTGVNVPGGAGATYGVPELGRVFVGAGGGGGGGGCDVPSGAGGAGGGAILLTATTLAITGNITAAGDNGVAGVLAGGGGGGAGGTLYLAGRTVTSTSAVPPAAPGGSGGSGNGGAGGAGRIRLECGTFNGTACAVGSGPGGTIGLY